MQDDQQYSGTMIANLQVTVDNLIYASYRANRLRSPEVAPERWALIFPDITELEERFQKEFPKEGTRERLTQFGIPDCLGGSHVVGGEP